MKIRLERAQRAWRDLKRRLTCAERLVARLLRRTARYAWYGSAVVLALLAAVITAARLMLPQLAERRAELEEYLSRWTAHQVRIERLSTFWDGLHPGLHIQGLAVYVEDRPRPSVQLDQVRLSLAVLPLLWGELRIYSLVLDGPKLSLERLADGRYRISGFDPIRAEGQAGDEGFFHWLFRQQRLAIENGELQWFDHREPHSALHLRRVSLTLRNRGERHKLGMTASFPEGMCGDCTFVADVTGNPFMREPWKGRIYVRARDVNLARFPLLVRERLPQALRGRFTVELWSEWKDMWPRAVHGALSVADLRLPVRGLRSPLAIREASGDLDWKGSAESWQLDLRRLRLALTGEIWDAGRVRLVRRPQAFQAHAKHIDLDDVTGFVQSLHTDSRVSANAPPWDNGWIARWAALAPGGSVRNLRFEFEGDPGAPEDFFLEADLTQIKVQADGGLPGVQGLSGHVRTRRHSGEFRLNATEAVIVLPWLFRQPLPAGRVSGRFVWERRATEWLVSGTELSLRASDGEGSGRLVLRVPHDAAVSPHLTLHADFRNGNGANAARYYPAGVLDPGVLAWMERSFLGGEVTTARLVYDGPVRAFPFRQDEGTFELRAHVRNGIYRYLPGWEPVRQAEAEVFIRGENVLITGYGRIGELAASDVVVRGERAPDGYALRVLGNVAGPVEETLRVLRDVQAPRGKGGWKDYLPEGLRGSGAGRLSLEVGIRLHDDEEEVRLAGEYRFLSSALKLPGMHLAVDGLDGEVRFSEAGVREGALRGRFLGGEARLAIATTGQGEVSAHAEGRLDAKALTPFLGKQIAPKVSGGAPWQATLRWHKGAATLQAEVALSGIKTTLPPPLDHPQGLPVEKLVVKTETGTASAHVLSLAAGSAVVGRFVFEKAPVWRFVRGRLAIGEPLSEPLPRGQGLYVTAGLQRLDVDPWLRLLDDGQLLTGYLAHVRADVRALRLFERDFGRLSLELARVEAGWSGSLQGTAAAGTVRLRQATPPAHVELDLAYFHLPPGKPTRSLETADPRRLPVVVLRARSFQVASRDLGQLELSAAPQPSGWRIERLTLTRPDMRFSADGHWRASGTTQQSEFDLRFTSPDLGRTMDALGIPDQVAGAETDIVAHLAWPGSPADLRYADLNGWIEISAKKGRFLRLKPGAGRLFGVLDLSAIGRYLTLDFSPIFGRGFVFDRLQARFTIERGNAYTQNFALKGPSANIGVVGRVGLATEDFDLVMEVRPQLSDSLTIATWGLFGPQVAAAVLALQKIFKKQITESTRVGYVVKGPWDNPEVTRLLRDNGERPMEVPSTGEGG